METRTSTQPCHLFLWLHINVHTDVVATSLWFRSQMPSLARKPEASEPTVPVTKETNPPPGFAAMETYSLVKDELHGRVGGGGQGLYCGATPRAAPVAAGGGGAVKSVKRRKREPSSVVTASNGKEEAGGDKSAAGSNAAKRSSRFRGVSR